MASKSDSPTFPTPERKELFTYGFPNVKWLKEMLFQDEPFDYILSRYCIIFQKKKILNFFFYPKFISKRFDKIISSLFFLGGFKFTLKPPYTIMHGNLLTAIWDTSHWTSFVKFGLKTA